MASPKKSQGFKTLSALRTEAKQKLAAGDKSLKGYYRDSKSKLMSKLGYSEDARNYSSSRNLTDRANKAAQSVAGDSEAKRAALKGRILRSVKREVDAARKSNPNVSQEELRKVAAGALGKELKAIKEGKGERNLRKEAAEKRKGEPKPSTPAKTTTSRKKSPASVLNEEMAKPAREVNRPMTQKESPAKENDYIARQFIDRNPQVQTYLKLALKRTSDKKMREALGLQDQNQLLSISGVVRDALGVSVMDGREGLKRRLAELYPEDTTTAPSKSTRAAKQQAEKEAAINNAARRKEQPAKSVPVEVTTDSPRTSKKKPSLGDRLRATADNLKESNAQTAYAASRIVRAAGQIAKNQDNLITEAADMARADLEKGKKLAAKSAQRKRVRAAKK